MTTVVRPAHVEELAEVGELTVAAYARDGFVAAEDGYADQLRDAVTRAREAEVYVAVDLAEKLLGTVTFCPEGSPWSELAGPGEGEFRMLAVASQARGHGVGGALVGVCLERCRELGYAAVVLSSMPQQQAAHRLYERLGFRRTPEQDWSPQAGVQLLGYRLEL